MSVLASKNNEKELVQSSVYCVGHIDTIDTGTKCLIFFSRFVFRRQHPKFLFAKRNCRIKAGQNTNMICQRLLILHRLKTGNLCRNLSNYL